MGMGLESKPEECASSWDSMREQDWDNLGTVVDLDSEIPWESLSSGGSVVSSDSQPSLPLTNEVSHDDYDISWLGAAKTGAKGCTQYNHVAPDCIGDSGFENTSCWPPVQRSIKRSSSPETVQKAELTCINSHENSLSSDDDSFSQDAGDDLPLIDDDSDSCQTASVRLHTANFSLHPGIRAENEFQPSRENPQYSDSRMCPGAWGTSFQSSQPGVALFPLHLFVTAIADGTIAPDTPNKTLGILEQVKNEGTLDLKMRVFALNSVEAKALGDYIDSHSAQVPAPFVVLARELCMALPYETSLTNPSQASAADRLRKQIKTHAVKVLRDVISDLSDVSTSMLRGYCGAMAPADLIEPVLEARSAHLDRDSKRKYIVLPVKRRLPQEDLSPREHGDLPGDSSPKFGRGHRAAPARIGGPQHWQQRGEHWPGASRLMIPSGPRSPDTSAPSTPGTPPPSRSVIGGGGHHLDDEDASAADGRPMAHFPVNLFVTAIADGVLARDTPPKVLHRLSQIVRKVPKEQNTSVDVADGGSVDLKMRVFVVNSEDAKAVGEYIQTHPDQVPAPFVVLARQLPMAVMYDPSTLDLSDASVADRLRKQAKTRAVKVLRESIGNRALGVTMAMLRGHSGATAPGDCLHEALVARTEAVEADGGRRGILFVARNKGSSAPSSPRKRAAADAGSDGGWDSPYSSAPPSPSGSAPASPSGPAPFPAPARLRAVGASRRTGASSASHLHRDMLDKAFKKVRTLDAAPEVPSRC